MGLKLSWRWGALLLTAALPSAFAFQLSPLGTAHEIAESNVNDGRVTREARELVRHGVAMFSRPVHETFTQLIYSCNLNWSDCANPNLESAGPYVMAGVRWNDDPGFELNTNEGIGANCRPESITFMRQTRCWITLFKDGERRSRTEPNEFMGPGRRSNLMTRSHFGDLQFLHAMASADGVTAEVTRAKVLMWAQFTWGIVTGDYVLNTDLSDIKITGFNQHFRRGANVQDLMTVGRGAVRPHIKHVAFGSLLHVVQDSFSKAHVVRREPVSGQRCVGDRYKQLGTIVSFSAYANQDHSEHSNYDSEDAARLHRNMDPDLVNVGENLRDMFDRAARWEEVETYLKECVFVLQDPTALSGPGVAPLRR